MKKSHLSKGVPFVAALLLTAAISVAQQPTQQAQQAAPALELYHIHFSKAAPGKLPQLIDAYKTGPAPEAGQPQVTPIIMRHREGGEWDLVTITPLGKQITLTASAPSQAVQDYYTKLGPLSDWHGDTFATGPAWAVVQKALVPAKDAQPVYVVSDYRSLAGHRAQLRQILDRNEQDTPGRSVLFAHVEGAPWNFLTVTSYDSWNAIGAPPPQPAAGTTPRPEAGLELREHMAVHHDTIAVYVSGGQPIR
ncbi:MAG TPA: hypothetical protein VFH15_00145 [Pyrinomonadaceae bacterium]|nr:hypothetical protein [Pyrinomonadaceae bacterium]